MNKKELLLLLVDVPDDAEVIISKDGEGNAYSPCCNCYYPLKYAPETTWRGVVYNPQDPDDSGWKYEENVKDAVVLYPTS